MQLSPPQVTRILVDAFKVWSDASKLNFQQVSKDQEADIQIEFLRGNHGKKIFNKHFIQVVLKHV